MSRLRADFWVSAYLRQRALEGVDAVLRRRGAAEAGAVFVKLDHLDGTASLYGPAPATADSGERLFTALMERAEPPAVEERMRRETRFDPDLWLLEVDSRDARHGLPLAPDG